MPVHYEVRDGVAILTMENPPVNSLDFTMRQALIGSLERANEAADVCAIVVTGNARVFCGGADIREFNTPQAVRAPTLPAVVAAFERSGKRVVAAIEGLALGGGLEMALGMSHRVADRHARVGLPEVKIGVLPGAGGTQRLPRAAGLERALNMIVTGEPVPAGDLSSTKLFDRITEGGVLEAAIALAREVGGRALPRVRDWKIEHPNAEGFLGFARSAVAAASVNYPAPLKCLEALEAAVKQPFDEGLRAERDAFAVLVNTTESKSLRHAFFSERAAAKVADIGPETRLRPIRRIGVIGGGTMGTGISMSFLNAGVPVTLVEVNQGALERGVATIRRTYESSAKKGRVSVEEMQRRLSLLAPALGYGAVADCDLIIEAVFEEYETKQSVFTQLDAAAKPGAILASNTSTLDIDRVAGFTRRPTDVLGLHFFSPAHVMRLLEVVRGAATAGDVLATVMALARQIGKTAVVAGVCDGFIGNRMIQQYSRQAGFLLEEGALPHQVDRAMEKFGFAMGPFRMSDLAGNDISWAIRKRQRAERSEMTDSTIADLLCALGRFGQKTGVGWYDYWPGDRSPHPSRLVDDLIEKHSRDLGLTRRAIADEEIVERLVYALVNEGARIVEDGIAARASDVDVVYLTGYGFPPWRGGPMFYADSIGLHQVLSTVRSFARGYRGEAWTPAPLLVRLAEAGQSFNG